MPRHTRVGRTVFAAGLLIFALGLVTLRVTELAGLDVLRGAQRFHGFRQSIYYPAAAFLDGVNPYDIGTYTHVYPTDFFPMYSPLTLLVHMPLGLLPVETSSLVYFGLNVSLMFLLALLLLHMNGRDAGAAELFGIGALLLLSRPGHMTLVLGQSAIETVVAACVALHCARTRPWLAGMALALTTFKPTLGVPLALLLACRRDWRAVIIGVAVAGVLTGVATARLAFEAGGLQPLLASMSATNAATEANAAVNLNSAWARVDAIALLARLAGHVPGTTATIAICVLVLGLGGLAVHKLSIVRDVRTQWLSDSVICLTVLICSYHQVYDVLLLAVPLTGLVLSPRNLDAWPIRWTLLALFALPAVNYVASAGVINALGITGLSWRVVTSANGAALLAAWLIVVDGALRGPAPARVPVYHRTARVTGVG
ncbi:MAG TPA: glycosyltransferase family 87 protein [Candidatus Binatia bacterium]|nr:glycosyltransferase family 87 protein [Candidatus Binatia bacterium]